MRRIFLYILLLTCTFGCMFVPKAEAQVTVDAKLDSAGIFIGQRIGLTVEVSADAKKMVELPQWDSLQQIVPGVEFVKSTPADTTLLNNGKRMMVVKKYYLTSFDTALYLIPELPVVVDGDTFKSKKLALKVVTYEIDTLNIDSIFPIKGEMAPPFVWSDWSLVLWLSFISVILTVILVYIIIRLKDNKPIIRHIRLKPRVAPHKVAMEKIEQIKEDRLLWQSEDSKEYYTQLTDTLRQYIKERYGFNATEMTSFEIIQKLQELNDETAIEELRELFQTADLVKFAKYSTLANENDRNLVSAIEYINQTKVEEEVKPQPEEIVVVEKRSRIAKVILVVSVSLAAIVLISVVAYLVQRLMLLAA